MATIYQQVAEETRASARKLIRGDDAPAIASSAPAGTSLPMADTPELAAGIADTHPHLLLAVLAHLDADDGLLERARPHIRSIYEGGPQIPDALAAEIRGRARSALLSPSSADARPITVQRLKEIASVITGEEIGDEAVPLFVDQMGFQPLGSFAPAPRQGPRAGFRVAVIGAGLSGLAAGIALDQAGYDYESEGRTFESFRARQFSKG